jgi:aminopeptidase
MKPDIRINRLARILVAYSVGVKEGENISISGTTASEPLLREIFREVLLAGAHPRTHLRFPDQEYLFYSLAGDRQIDYLNPIDIFEYEQIDASISTVPDLNPHALSSIDPKKKQHHLQSQRRLFDIIMKRWAEGGLRWVGTVCPSPALAQEARMAFDEYAEFVFACCGLNEEDPVRYWRDLSRFQQKLCDRLNEAKKIRYTGLDTDLEFSCEGRKWVNCDGKNNFPDGEVFTGPVEDSVEGTIRFTYPGIFRGEEVEDIRLRFEKGKVVEARAAKGEKLLHALLDTDEGARYAGEIAIGTNDNIFRFTKNMLLDEKMGGTVHLAVGRGLPQSGSLNLSSVHWDMLKDMRSGGEIFADGRMIYKNGKFID